LNIDAIQARTWDSVSIPTYKDETLAIDKSLEEDVFKSRKKRSYSNLIGISGTTESGSVELADNTEPAYKVGIMSQVQIHRRIGVSTGLLATYRSFNVENNQNVNFLSDMRSMIASNQGTDVQSLESSTKIGSFLIEIPSEIIYQILPAKKNQLVLATGVSSFLYLNQSYTYKTVPFQSPGGNNQREYTLYNNLPLFNLAGTMNIRLIWQRNISKRLALQISPYTQLPISGIGRENLKLTSVGLSTGLFLK
jgi:hypothetical protein